MNLYNVTVRAEVYVDVPVWADSHAAATELALDHVNAGGGFTDPETLEVICVEEVE